MLWLAVRACSDGPWLGGPDEAEVLVTCVTGALALGLAGPVRLADAVGLTVLAGERVLGVAPMPGKPVGS